MSANTVIPPIPACYACYLLRSTKRHANQYVGSTPNPIRRLRQHNGVTKGGASKTSRITLRPWEMVTLVTGFPSSIAALQFEWAWQNTHLTRHVSAESRLVQARSNVRVSPRTGKARRRPARPRMSLTDRLANLHLLLSSSSFRRLPLRVTFYAADVHKMYQRWTKQQLVNLPRSIDVALDPTSPATTTDETMPASAPAIKAIDVGYDSFKPQLEKTSRLIDDAEWLQCAVCDDGVSTEGHGVLFCSHPGCDSMSHIKCLSTHFLKLESKSNALIPTSGTCPSCKGQLQWVDLVKELTLRMRGAKQVEEVFRQKRQKRVQDEDSDDDLPDEAIDIDDMSEEDGDEDEAREPATKAGAKTIRLATPELVIEDSDWDDALLLT